MEIIVGGDEGRWPRGTRVKKIMSQPGDSHQDGASGTIVGALGPISASQRAELIMGGMSEDVECIYWVEWDDLPGIPVAIADFRVEPIQ